MSEESIKPRRDAYLVAGAPLVIVAGILSLVNGAEALFAISNTLPFLSNSEATVFPICGALLIVLGAISIAGGIYALTPHPHLLPIVVAAAAGIMGGGLLGFFLGFAAIILFWMANVDL